MDKLEVLNAALKKAVKCHSVDAVQIPVAWAIAKGTIGVTRTKHVKDAVKAANMALTAKETVELEGVADSLELNVTCFWEKEMK